MVYGHRTPASRAGSQPAARGVSPASCPTRRCGVPTSPGHRGLPKGVIEKGAHTVSTTWLNKKLQCSLGNEHYWLYLIKYGFTL